ncbi:MAG: hypothetical protein JST54_27215 [Deltaproteobacteria bacterium]|nr:hypothetical protein [Deltaproteobacteria bacterium]
MFVMRGKRLAWAVGALLALAAPAARAQTLTVGSSGNTFGPSQCGDATWGGAAGHVDTVIPIQYAAQLPTTGTIVGTPTQQLFATEQACPAVDTTNNSITLPSDAITLVQAGTQITSTNTVTLSTLKVSELAAPSGGCATSQTSVWNVCYFEFYTTQTFGGITTTTTNGSLFKSITVTYDSQPPGAPDLTSVSPGDSHLSINFDPPSDSDIGSFQVLVAPVGAQAAPIAHIAPSSSSTSGSSSGSTGTTGTTAAGSDSGSSGSTGAASDSGSSGSSGSTGSGSSSGSSGSSSASSSGSSTGASGFTAYPCNANAQVVATLGPGVTSGVIPDSTTLVNGTTYSVQVRAIDQAGNVGACSNAMNGTPQVIDDFWRLYKAAGGSGDGGCTAAGGAAGLLGLLGVALTLGGRIRRSRRKDGR